MSLPWFPGTPPARVDANKSVRPSGVSIGQPSAAGVLMFASGTAVLQSSGRSPGSGAPPASVEPAPSAANAAATITEPRWRSRYVLIAGPLLVMDRSKLADSAPAALGESLKTLWRML
jgi:hypothetical protein